MGFTIAALMQLAVVTAGDGQYQAAVKGLEETGRPMVVLVGTDWCPACRQMKQSTIPALRGSGALDEVGFVTLDSDQHPELARELMEGRSIPQLVMFTKTATGYRKTWLIGGQSPSRVERFIEGGVTTPSSNAVGAN